MSVDFADRRSLARSSGGIRAVVERLGMVRSLEQRWHARRGDRLLAISRRRRADGRHVVRRWNGGARSPLCFGRWKKRDPEEPQDHAIGRSRGGLTTKIHMLCDADGRPLHFHLTAGQSHEAPALIPLLEGADAVLFDADDEPIAWPLVLAGDKGYRADWIDEYLLELGITPVIPSKGNQDREVRRVEFDADAYRHRNIIERLIGWLKECRRILTRFEKTAKNFGGMIKLAFIHRYFRILGL